MLHLSYETSSISMNIFMKKTKDFNTASGISSPIETFKRIHERAHFTVTSDVFKSDDKTLLKIYMC